MRKLELKDIAGYLPYGLKMLGEGNHIYPIENNLYINNLLSKIFMYKNLTPILRPLSDLYRTITHNGKEIVSIVELARIHNPGKEWKLCTDEPFAVVGDFYFDYCKGFNCYEETILEMESLEVCNQYQLFDYLHELKIDYRGLIDAGLAIDVNKLDINPYF